MKVIVLNGSPKGDLSVTLQSVKYIEKKSSSLSFKVINISKNIKAIEKKKHLFNEILDEISSADAVLWATPVYVYLVPSQLMRFIELIWEKKAQHVFKGKYSGVITTSIHFFDHCAHNYLSDISDDLGMKFAGSFSADSYDLLKEDERNRLLIFSKGFIDIVKNNKPYAQRCFSDRPYFFVYQPDNGDNSISTNNKKIVIITDGINKPGNINKMITRFTESFCSEIDIIDINELDIKGGCTGCVQCGFEHKCIYTNKDDYVETYTNRVKTADVIIFAGEIHNRFFSSKFKQFFDRGFFSNHTPTLNDKQIGFIVAGPLDSNANIRQFIEAYVEWQGGNLVDIITDEINNSETIDTLLQNFAIRTMNFDNIAYRKPKTFLGLAGMKLFRDDIWGRHRFVFQADHKYYEENGFYDFPQKDERSLEVNQKMFEATSTPEGKEAIRKILAKEMVRPHIKKVEEA